MTASFLFVCEHVCQRPPARLGRGLLLALAFLSCGPWILAQANPQSLEDYFRQAKELEKKEDYSGAEKIYQEAARNYPNQPEILKRLGIVYQTELKFPESMEAFRKVLEQAPQYPEVNFYLGMSYFGVNEFEKAIESFDKELEANSKFRPARYYEAMAFRSLNRVADALRQYEILLQDDPTDKRALYQLIRLLKSATLQAINQLGNLDPDSDYMLVLKAEGYAEEQKYAEAIRDYQEALRKNPHFPGIHFALGEVYYNKVDYPSAEKELHAALSEDPNHLKANYYLASILIKNQKTAEAIPLLRIVVAGSPQFMMGYLDLGKCYAAQGKLQEAVKMLEKAAELDPHEKQAPYQLAQLYTRLKQPDKARQQMEIFQKLYAQEREKKAKSTQRLLELQKSLSPSN